jgi:hypothetical protein
MNIEDGTLCRQLSPSPGHQNGVKRGSFADYVRRAANVKEAFLRGIHVYAYDETLEKLGDDFKAVLDSLWPGFVQAAKIYAWSIGGGAAVFGVLGAIFGGGVGALPGAELGADLGAAAATAILFCLGLGFLAEFVLSHFDQANEHFERGFDLAWDADGPAPDLAAREFGRGIAELCSLLFEAAAAWVIRKGLEKGPEDLRESKIGEALEPYAKVQYWRDRIGVTDAPIPRRGIAAAIEFFEEVRPKIEPRLRKPFETEMEGWMKGMDFSDEVIEDATSLQPGKELIAYKDRLPGNPNNVSGFFFTEVGTSMERVAVADITKRYPAGDAQGPPELVERQYVRYRVKKNVGPVKALKSKASGVRSHDVGKMVTVGGKQYWRGDPVSGGAAQYFIPNAAEVLEIINDLPSQK